MKKNPEINGKGFAKTSDAVPTKVNQMRAKKAKMKKGYIYAPSESDIEPSRWNDYRKSYREIARWRRLSEETVPYFGKQSEANR